MQAIPDHSDGSRQGLLGKPGSPGRRTKDSSPPTREHRHRRRILSPPSRQGNHRLTVTSPAQPHPHNRTPNMSTYTPKPSSPTVSQPSSSRPAVNTDLDEAIAQNDYRTANIRAGYVYVISNRGAFGDNVVKIGLTRRLEPIDRVNELGGASVPFRFDVHALFFSEDAVTLERELHEHFTERAVNLANSRKEFFFASPSVVRAVLEDKVGNLLEFTERAESTEYLQSGADGPPSAPASAHPPGPPNRTERTAISRRGPLPGSCLAGFERKQDQPITGQSRVRRPDDMPTCQPGGSAADEATQWRDQPRSTTRRCIRVRCNANVVCANRAVLADRNRPGRPAVWASIPSTRPAPRSQNRTPCDRGFGRSLQRTRRWCRRRRERQRLRVRPAARTCA